MLDSPFVDEGCRLYVTALYLMGAIYEEIKRIVQKNRTLFLFNQTEGATGEASYV